jgi:hydroxyquinol 1,2-dioxygenase
MSDTENQSARQTPEQLTADVVASFDGCGDERLRELMQALVRHLHGFVSEVKLTPQEWARTIGTLTRTGQITDEHRQEFVLWSDSLGVSMLVDAIENTLPAGATESTVLGPFYVPEAPVREYGATIAEEGDAGTPALVHGRVLDLDGAPIAGAELDVWQNGDDRLYAVQRPEAPEDHLRGRFFTRDDGSYAFVAVRPVPYPIPYDGPVGAMLEQTGRHPWRPAHIHMIVRVDGYRTVTTHVFDQSSEYLDSDAVFAVKPTLLREFITHRPDAPGTPDGITTDWVSVRNDLVLAPAVAADNGSRPGRPWGAQGASGSSGRSRR